jgi:hypothetical protein
MRHYLLLLLALLSGWPLPWSAAAAAEKTGLSPFGATYQLKTGNMLFGEVRVELTLSPTGRYRYQSLTIPVGLAAVLRSDQVTEQSSGRIGQCGITPEHYLYQHQKASQPRQTELTFDWVAGRVTNHSRGSHWSMRVPPGTQDKFSQQLELMLRINEGCSSPLQFPVADGGRLKQYRFERGGETWTETPTGRFRTIRLTRSKDRKSSRATLWLAPALGYLPVRIEKRDGSGKVVMELSSFSRDPENSPERP